MKTIYIDSEFKCHTSNDGTMIAVEEEFFDNKCDTFIEGFRLKPEGETLVREDGEVFSGGEMITPWKDYSELDRAQLEYEKQLLAESISLSDLTEAYQEGVNSV